MLSRKIVDLEVWLEMNPNHENYTAKKRDLTHYYIKLKNLEINDAFPAENIHN
jgi:hypothetical protein